MQEAPAGNKLKKPPADALELLAVFQTLPDEAQKGGYDGSVKSYTLADPQRHKEASKISVLIQKKLYYVSPVKMLGDDDQLVYKITAQEK